MKRTSALILSIAVTGAVLTGCSIVDTAPDQIALHYNGGIGESQTFKECVPKSTNQWNSPNDSYFYYPFGDRPYEFSNRDGADFKALQLTTKDGQIVFIDVQVVFALNTSCEAFKDAQGVDWPGGKLQKFHEKIANKFKAAAEDYSQPMGDGWKQLLDSYLRVPLQQVAQNAVQEQPWLAAYADPAVKDVVQKAIQTNLPKAAQTLVGEDFFEIKGIIVQKPEISKDLQDQLTAQSVNEQAAKAAKVNQDVANNWPGGLNAYIQYLANQAAIAKTNAEAKALNDGKAWLVPSGAIVNVPPPPAK
jgi:hypothetical protein